MAKCDICGKGVSFGIKVKAVVNGAHKTVHVCTRCLRSGKVQRAV